MAADVSEAARHLPWVIVRVGPSRLGIPSRVVREMMALPGVARVPGLPADLPGVITWRGHVLPLVDLRVRLQLAPATGDTGPPMAVVVGLGEGRREQAFAVDGIDGVEALEAESIAPLPDGLDSQSAMVREFGRLRRDGSVVLLLDVAETLGVRVAPPADGAPPSAASLAAPATRVDAGASDTKEPEPVGVATRPTMSEVAAAPRARASGKGSRSPRHRTAS